MLLRSHWDQETHWHQHSNASVQTSTTLTEGPTNIFCFLPSEQRHEHDPITVFAACHWDQLSLQLLNICNKQILKVNIHLLTYIFELLRMYSWGFYNIWGINRNIFLLPSCFCFFSHQPHKITSGQTDWVKLQVTTLKAPLLMKFIKSSVKAHKKRTFNAVLPNLTGDVGPHQLTCPC